MSRTLRRWIHHTLVARYPLDVEVRGAREGGVYPLDWRLHAPRLPDPRAIPMGRGPNGEYLNPVAVGLYALARHAELARGAHTARVAFLVPAETLLRSQDAEGGWRYPVPVPRYGVGPGWYSGMAQGIAISVFLRAWAISGDQAYLDAVDGARTLMLRRTSDGGCALVDGSGRPFIEECPSQPPSMILNGAIFALIGWLELDAEAARHACDRLAELLPAFGNGHWSRYDLRYGASASYAYHRLHISQLQVLSRLTGDERHVAMAARWERQARRIDLRARAAAEKAAFAIRHARR